MCRFILPLLLAAVTCPAVGFAQTGASDARSGRQQGLELRSAELSPLGFLDALRTHRDVLKGVRVWPPSSGWVRVEDMPALVALVRSTEVVAVTCGIVSAHAVPPKVRSTLGWEAMRLIEGYRRGRWDAGCSDLAPPGDPGEVERWWAGQEVPP